MPPVVVVLARIVENVRHLTNGAGEAATKTRLHWRHASCAQMLRAGKWRSVAVADDRSRQDPAAQACDNESLHNGDSNMRTLGDGQVHFYEEKDFVPHPFPADAEWWNESVFLNFADPRTGVYATLRLGHQPNWNGGHASIWSMVGTPRWIYKRDGLYPLRDGDRLKDGLSARGTHRYRYDGGVHWQISDEGIELDLRMRDYHQPFSFWPRWKNMAANHLEASGSISGRISLNGEQFEIQGAPAYRDQSWDVRHWHNLRSHRWVSTTFGEDLSCNVLALYSHEAIASTWGYVRQGDTISTSSDVDVVTFVEPDGISHRGGRVRYRLPNGQDFEVLYERINVGMLSRQHEVIINDTACIARHDAQVGGACFETTNNILAGTSIPPQRGLAGSLIANGLWPAKGPFGEG
jgi:hypothetical protein